LKPDLVMPIPMPTPVVNARMYSATPRTRAAWKTLLAWVVRWPDAALIYSLLTTLTLNRT